MAWPSSASQMASLWLSALLTLSPRATTHTSATSTRNIRTDCSLKARCGAHPPISARSLSAARCSRARSAAWSRIFLSQPWGVSVPKLPGGREASKVAAALRTPGPNSMPLPGTATLQHTSRKTAQTFDSPALDAEKSSSRPRHASIRSSSFGP